MQGVTSPYVEHTLVGHLKLLVWIAAMESWTGVTIPHHGFYVFCHVAPKNSTTKLLLHHVFAKVSPICKIQDVLPISFWDNNFNIVLKY